MMKNKIIKYSLIFLGISIGFSFLTKFMSVILDSEYFKIVLNAIFGGIGTAIGIWFAGNHIIDRFFRNGKKDGKKE